MAYSQPVICCGDVSDSLDLSSDDGFPPCKPGGPAERLREIRRLVRHRKPDRLRVSVGAHTPERVFDDYP